VCTYLLYLVVYYSAILICVLMHLVVVFGLSYFAACLVLYCYMMSAAVLLSCMGAWCVVYDRVTGTVIVE
jgi:hypothetical protein